MRSTSKPLIALALLCSMHVAFSQETPKTVKPGFFVLNQFKVPMANVAKMNSYQDSIFAPILNELVKEGKLLGWGQLDHQWGDEWNVNFYYMTENHQAFIDFWREYLARIYKRFPGAMDAVAPLVSEHKDNMYSIRFMR